MEWLHFLAVAFWQFFIKSYIIYLYFSHKRVAENTNNFYKISCMLGIVQTLKKNLYLTRLLFFFKIQNQTESFRQLLIFARNLSVWFNPAWFTFLCVTLATFPCKPYWKSLYKVLVCLTASIAGFKCINHPKKMYFRAGKFACIFYYF